MTGIIYGEDSAPPAGRARPSVRAATWPILDGAKRTHAPCHFGFKTGMHDSRIYEAAQQPERGALLRKLRQDYRAEQCSALQVK